MGCTFGLSGGVRPEAEAVLVSGIEIDGRGRPVQATKIAMSTSYLLARGLGVEAPRSVAQHERSGKGTCLGRRRGWRARRSPSRCG